MRFRFLEVSHKIEPGMETYPGLPAPQLEVLATHESSRQRYGGQAEFYLACLRICGNTGTYVDAPLHRYRHGKDLASYPLERLAHLPATIIDARSQGRAIPPQLLDGRQLQGRAVLFLTGWSRHWRTPAYFGPAPFLTRATAERLIEEGAAFAGIDSLNIDAVEDLSRPVHTLLLGAGIPICEHMTRLEEAPPEGSWLHAVPIAWVGGPSFPVRAYLMIPE